MYTQPQRKDTIVKSPASSYALHTCIWIAFISTIQDHTVIFHEQILKENKNP